MSSSPLLSLIVPVWGSEPLLPELILKTADDPGLEWIVAAVEPACELKEVAAAQQIQLVQCERPSRGEQMNCGAARARGQLLVFHHADTELTEEHILALKNAALAEVVGGAFQRHFDQRHSWMRRFEPFIHRHLQRAMPVFGDQSIFVRRDVFEELNGYAAIPLMEDLEFSRRLKKRAPLCYLAPAIASSTRRFDKIGSWRSSVFNGALILLFYLGASPTRLHRWYYRRKKKQTTESVATRPERERDARQVPPSSH